MTPTATRTPRRFPASEGHGATPGPWQLAGSQARARSELDRICPARDAAVEALAQNQRHMVMVRHDLCQPLYTLSLLAEAIAMRTCDPALQSTVAQLRRVTASMGTLFDNLLDPDRIDRPAVPVPLQMAQLQLLMADVLASSDEAARRAGLSLRARSGRFDDCVIADPLLLQRALGNLVQNALRYTPNGGVLLVVRRRGGQLRFEVHDTGVGLAEEDTQRVFAPYQRTAQGQRLNAGGQGLGLAIVARCAELMGASCGVRSVPGRGSCFWLSLPASTGALDGRSLRPASSNRHPSAIHQHACHEPAFHPLARAPGR